VTNTGQLISGRGFDVKVEIGCKYPSATRTCQREIFREKPTGAAAHLPNDPRLVRPACR